LLATYLFYAQHPRFAGLLKPRAGFAAATLGLLLLIFFVAVIVAHPVLIAPGFNPTATTPSALPWLLVTITGGALAGIYLLFAHQFTAPALRHLADSREVGYGAVILEGMVAVSAVIICSAGFASATEWKQFYASWSGIQEPAYLLELYINGFVYFASYLGINENFASNLGAVALLSLTLVSLEAVLRLLRVMGREAGEGLGFPIEENGRRPLIVMLVTIVVLSANAVTSEATALIPLFGASNQLLAAFGMLLLVVALERQQRPGQLVLGMTLVLLPAILWAIALQLGAWWSQGSWGLVLVSLLLFAR
jgi:carbon starvation protein